MAAQLCGGKISAAFASTRRKWSMIDKTVGLNSMGQSCGFLSSLLWANRKGCEDVSGVCYLSTGRRKLSWEAVIRCRKPFHNATNCLLGSNCSVDPCDVDKEPRDVGDTSAEDSILEKDNAVNSLSVHVSHPLNQFPPHNVKRELIMLSLPAIASQAIDPMAQLMETAYIGGLG